MLVISVVVLGSPSLFVSAIVPVNTTVFGLKFVALLRFCPWKRRAQERVVVPRISMGTQVLPVFDIILGIARMKTLLPTVVFAVSPPKFPRIYAMVGFPGAAVASFTRVVSIAV